jgi:WD40 repeat protein
VRLFVRQVRPFMARREGRTDYFYEAFKLAARARYSDRMERLNALLAGHFLAQADPAGDLSFKGESIRDFNELPYHLAEAGRAGYAQAAVYLEQILSTYLWIRRKGELSDIHNVIGDYGYIDAERAGNYHLKMIRDTLVMSVHLLATNIKTLPTQMWGRLKEIDNPRIKAFLPEIERHTDYPWLKPRHYMHSPGEALKISLPGHDGGTYGVHVSSDGKYITAAGIDRIKIWDWKNGMESRKLTGYSAKHDFMGGKYSHAIHEMCVSPDAKRIAIPDIYNLRDIGIMLWDSEKGTGTILTGHTDSVRHACFSPDGKYLASGSNDSTARIWDCETGKEAFVLRHVGAVNRVCFSPDGGYLVTGTIDHHTETGIVGRRITIWDWKREQDTGTLEGHDGSWIISLCFTTDGKYLISGGDDCTLRLWDFETKRQVRQIDHLPEASADISASSDGKHIAVASYKGKVVRIYDTENWTVVKKIECPSRTRDVAFLPDGKHIATGSANGIVMVWEWEKQNKDIEEEHVLFSVRFSPDDRRIAAGSAKGDNIRIFDVQKGENEFRLKRDGVDGQKLDYSPDGKYLLSKAKGDKVLWVWDMQRREVVRKLEGHTNSVWAASFSPDGKYIASAGKTVRIWDWMAEKEVARIVPENEPQFSYKALHFSPNGIFLALPHKDETIRANIGIWNWIEQRLELEVPANKYRSLQCVCFSPDGRHLAAGFFDGRLVVWDLFYKKEVANIKTPKEIEELSFSRDGRYILLGGEAMTVEIWDWEKQIPCIVLGTDENLHSCVFSHDNRLVAAGGYLGRILLYDVKNLDIGPGIVTVPVKITVPVPGPKPKPAPVSSQASAPGPVPNHVPKSAAIPRSASPTDYEGRLRELQNRVTQLDSDSRAKFEAEFERITGKKFPVGSGTTPAPSPRPASAPAPEKKRGFFSKLFKK